MIDGCKLTRADGTTRSGMQWGPGVRHEAPGKGPLCTAGWVHWYPDPLLAVMMDPIHGGFGPDALLWRITAEGRTLSDGTKSGSQIVTTIETISLPVVTLEQWVRFAILASLELSQRAGYGMWAEAWLSGADRSAEAAGAAREASVREAWEASEWAEWAATAAEAVVAAEAAEAAAAAAEAWAAVDSEWMVSTVKAAVAWAAERVAVEMGEDIDLVAIAHGAVEVGR